MASPCNEGTPETAREEREADRKRKDGWRKVGKESATEGKSKQWETNKRGNLKTPRLCRKIDSERLKRAERREREREEEVLVKSWSGKL